MGGEGGEVSELTVSALVLSGCAGGLCGGAAGQIRLEILFFVISNPKQIKCLHFHSPFGDFTRVDF